MNKTKLIAIRLDENIFNKTKEISEKHDLSVSHIVRQSLKKNIQCFEHKQKMKQFENDSMSFNLNDNTF
jgi:predicted transcriptional regulator